MTYRICPDCGASLDPVERCDCQDADNLPAIRCTVLPVIDDNLESVGSRIASMTASVSGYPKDDEHLKKVKELRARLRKELDQMEKQRIAVKNAVMQPYELANQRYKELISSQYEKADVALKSWVDSYQNGMKRACEEKLREYFQECCRSFRIDFLEFEDCGVSVDMAMVRQKEPTKAMERIYDYVQSVRNVLDAIAGMENGAEVLAEYRNCKSIREAIAEVTARKQAKASAQEFIDGMNRFQKQQGQEIEALADAVAEAPIEDTYKVAFLATGTLDALKAMKAYAITMGIKLEEINKEDESK